jgi:two-component system chemotaxis response regulator CheY
MPRKMILIVEDDRDLQELLRKRLESKGFDCESAYTVESALHRLKESPPDLVLLDLGFQDANGTVFLNNARQWLPEGREMPPIIVLSCFNDKEVVDFVLDQGASGFLAKPYDPTVLVSTINEYLP